MNRSLARPIWERVNGRCEYCQMPQSADAVAFEIDHVIARKHRGPTDADNLCLSCATCNHFKGSDLSSVDPLMGRMTWLYQPRRHHWRRHFRWGGALLVGKPPRGRATISLLRINDIQRVALRAQLIAEGVFPPV